MTTSPPALPYKPASGLLNEVLEMLRNPPTGVPLTWFPQLDNALGGFRPNEITLLCAPTGAGKTQLLACLSAMFLSQRVPHFVAPVETGDMDFLARVLSVLVEHDLNTGLAQGEGVLHKAEVLSELLKIGEYLFVSTHDSRVDVDDMLNMLKYQSQVYGIKVALLDNLNFFLKITSAQNERAEMDEAIHKFVMLAKHLPIHIVLIVHPRKTDGGRVESEFDIKGSSTAVQECSNVALFNRYPDKVVADGMAHTHDRELVFKKLRKRGAFVNTPFKLSFKNARYWERSGR